MSEVERASRVSACDDARVLESRMRVMAMQDGWLQLQGERTASCAACAAKSGCGVKGLSDFMQQSPARLCVPRVGGPAVGDEVVVSMSGDEFLQLTMLAYLLPAVALAATACLSALIGLGDAATAILALIAFAISFLPLWWRGQAGCGLKVSTIEEPRQYFREDNTSSRPQVEDLTDGNQK